MWGAATNISPTPIIILLFIIITIIIMTTTTIRITITSIMIMIIMIVSDYQRPSVEEADRVSCLRRRTFSCASQASTRR